MTSSTAAFDVRDGSATSPPHDLRTDGRCDPLGVDNPRPRLTWRTDVPQAAFDVRVTGPGDVVVWESGEVDGAGSAVVTPTLRLASRSVFRWQVRVRGELGDWSGWSEEATFETGILGPDEWTARWVTAPFTSKKDRRALYFRAEADLSAPVVRARAYVSALGWYRLFVNGNDLTGHALVPRWTPFGQYAEYQVYDVTDALTEGGNVIAVAVADGRYRGTLGILHRRANYGNRLAALVQIEAELADGSLVTIGSDADWRVGEGRIRSADPKTGERVDLRIDDEEWLRPGGAALREQPVELAPSTPPRLVAEETERVDLVERLPGTVSRTPSGVQLVDFGQNFAGVARIRLSGPAGSLVKLEYSEVLTKDGELDTGYLLGQGHREWFQRDEVVLDGAETDYTPWFTIHGFRYIAVHGPAGDLRDEDVEGLVLSSKMHTIAEFHASDHRLERLWHNVRWSMRSNFVDTPTDCPTRERSGWTGDIQVFGPTALQVADAAPFLRRYLRNVAAEQAADGTIPPIIPAEDSPGYRTNVLARATAGSVGWGDVAVMLPWNVYRYTGDSAVLVRQYDSAKAWVDQLARRAWTKRRLSRRLPGRGLGAYERYLVDTGYHWGEWLRPGTEMPVTTARNIIVRPNSAIATAYLAHSSLLLSRIAGVLGKDDDVAAYATLSARVRDAWRLAFVRDGGSRISEDKQDDYVRALAFGLLEDPDQRRRATERLVELVEAADWHLGTGFLSTPMLLPALVDEGRADVAFRLLLQTTSPSWLGAVERGATTTWETWEGYDADGNAHESHNHYAFGTVVQFLQERLAGLEPLEPGYRRIRVAPLVDGPITSASLRVDTPLGPASAGWARRDGAVRLDVTVPPGATAEVHLRGAVHEVAHGTHGFDA